MSSGALPLDGGPGFNGRHQAYEQLARLQERPSTTGSGASLQWKVLFHLICECFLSGCSTPKSGRLQARMIRLLSRHPWVSVELLQKYDHLPWDAHALVKHMHGFTKDVQAYIDQVYTPSFRNVRPYLKPTRTLRDRRRRVHSYGHIDYPMLEAWMKDVVQRDQPSVVDIHILVKKISRHVDLPLQLVCQYPQLPWNWKVIFMHQNWTVALLHLLLEKGASLVRWKWLSRNRFLTITTVEVFMNQPWDWVALSHNAQLPPQAILDHPRLLPKWKWKQALTHFRLSPQFWLHHAFRRNRRTVQHLSQWESAMVAPLLANRFLDSPEAVHWAHQKLACWVYRRIQIRQLRRRLHVIYRSVLTQCMQKQHGTSDDSIRHIFEYIYAPPLLTHTIITTYLKGIVH